MKFRQKIWMLPFTAAVVFVAGSLASYLVGLSTSGALNDLRAEAYPGKEGTDRLLVQVDLFRASVQAAAAEGDAAKLEEAAAAAKAARTELGKLAGMPSLAAAAAPVAKAFDAYEPAAMTAAKAMAGKGDAGDSMARMTAGKTALDAAGSKLRSDAEARVNDLQVAAAGGVARGLWVQMITGLATLVTLGIASVLVIRSVWRDLGDEPARLRELTDRIAGGDLLAVDDDAGGSDVHSLRGALARMTVALQSTVSGIRTGAAAIADASSEIEAGNQDLSVRTEQTASNLQQTASAMEQMTRNVQQTASSAQQASDLARRANESAHRGGDVFNGVVANMTEIADASKRIGEITGVIDGIAFQTNILALNAAVEAARAGEQGRGFAVVASEVRTLAQRSAQAAREIKQLIALSAEKVEGGSRQVSDAGAAMAEIVNNVQHVARIIDEITTATGEQSGGLSSVNDSVARLDEMTQQNSALVEQSAAAAGSLLQQAQGLVQSVAVFRVRGASEPESLARI
jgi:methyl-accepting chemotaxis protein